MTIQQTTRLCSLESAVDNTVACPEDACPFWEPGGAALAGRCAFEQLDVAADAALAAWLLEIRGRLASAASSADEDAQRSLCRHLLNDSSE
jgi:hypothetical protein